MTPTATAPEIRHDWSLDEIGGIYGTPLVDLVLRAQLVHRAHHAPNEVQACVLLNVKSGGCPEDCAYCPQSAHYKTGVTRHGLLSVEEALTAYTRTAAFASFAEHDRGTIAPGMLADLTVIDRDLRTIPPAEIRNAKIVRTIVGGKTVFAAGS